MFTPTNPQNEQFRAQAMLSSLTEQKKAAELFAPKNTQCEKAEVAAPANRINGQAITRVFNAIKLNRHPVVNDPVQVIDLDGLEGIAG